VTLKATVPLSLYHLVGICNFEALALSAQICTLSKMLPDLQAALLGEGRKAGRDGMSEAFGMHCFLSQN